MQTVLQPLGEFAANRLYCKRDDLFPFSFGGNKARKAALFFEEIRKGGYDCVVSYGSGSSNHCRITANRCAALGLDCELITPKEASEDSFNLRMTELFGAKRIVVPVQEVHDCIESRLQELRQAGRKPYFIPGGGHGDLGTRAYVECFQELSEQSEAMGVRFDYLFLASGTGTTQAGLICGRLLSGSGPEIIGISIARPNPRGRDVVLDSCRSYLRSIGRLVPEQELQNAAVFLDDYVSGGYGAAGSEIDRTILTALRRWGLPLDSTYTGKAFYGMEQYLRSHNIQEKNLLFLHTGGTPLFFDDLKRISC